MEQDTGQQKRDLLWCCLSLGVLYSLGGVLFSTLERGSELEGYTRNRLMYDRMQELYQFSHCSEPFFENMAFCQNQEKFDEQLARMFARSGNAFSDQEKWTFLGSVFFVHNLVTTIGYGSIYPKTPGGMICTICFGLLGIPIVAYALRIVANLAVSSVGSVSQKSHSVITSVFGVALVCLGALCYTFLEGWGYFESLYFTFITLSSVGFGDYVPTTAASKVFTVFFVILGLGTFSACIKMVMINFETSTQPLVAQLGESYQTFCDDCCHDREKSKAAPA